MPTCSPAARHIPAGTVISAEMLTAKSPGNGIAANQLERLVGRVAAVEVPRDSLLPPDALGWDLRAQAHAREAR